MMDVVEYKLWFYRIARDEGMEAAERAAQSGRLPEKLRAGREQICRPVKNDSKKSPQPVAVNSFLRLEFISHAPHIDDVLRMRRIFFHRFADAVDVHRHGRRISHGIHTPETCV